MEKAEALRRAGAAPHGWLLAARRLHQARGGLEARKSAEPGRDHRFVDGAGQQGAWEAYSVGHQNPLFARRSWNSSTFPVATLSVAGLPVHLV